MSTRIASSTKLVQPFSPSKFPQWHASTHLPAILVPAAAALRPLHWRNSRAGLHMGRQSRIDQDKSRERRISTRNQSEVLNRHACDDAGSDERTAFSSGRSEGPEQSLQQKQQSDEVMTEESWHDKPHGTIQVPSTRVWHNAQWNAMKASDYPESQIAIESLLREPRATLQLFAEIGYEVSIMTATTRGGFVCMLRYIPADSSLSPVEITSTEKPSVKKAILLSYKRLIYWLHMHGRLKEVLPVTDPLVSPHELRENRDVLLKVYEYAAQLKFLPRITTKCVASSNKQLHRALIAIPEHGLQVTAYHRTMALAVYAAAIKFTHCADKYIEQSGLTETDGHVLKAGHATRFLTFLRKVGRLSKLSIRAEKVDSDIMSCAVVVDGKTLIEGLEVIGSKARAVQIGTIVTAMMFCQHDPALLAQYWRYFDKTEGFVVEHLAPLDLPLEESTIYTFGRTLSTARAAGLPDAVETLPHLETDTQVRRPRQPPTRSKDKKARQRYLKVARRNYLHNAYHEGMREHRSRLPVVQMSKEILDTVDENQFTIIRGATGSGKTTQLPQILLDGAVDGGTGLDCNIICTQPRRIAATAIAQRVAKERGESLGTTVGFHIRGLNSEASQDGSINFMTTGILLNRMKDESDTLMDTTSHIIIDEVHERDTMMDFLMVSLRHAVNQRLMAGKTAPKIICMSATLDDESFASFFAVHDGQGNRKKAARLSIPGRSHSVTTNYLDDLIRTVFDTHGRQAWKFVSSDQVTLRFLRLESQFALQHGSEEEQRSIASTLDKFLDRDAVPESDRAQETSARESFNDGDADDADQRVDLPAALIALTIAHLAKTTSEGTILVFVPGIHDILSVHSQLTDRCPLDVNFDDEGVFDIVHLHSSLHEEQRRVFVEPHRGIRRIVLATNIAETSITIPNVRYVIDSAHMKESSYDSYTTISELRPCWISKSSAQQRAGRAGRVQNGELYALYSRPRLESLIETQVPQILRTDLQTICMQVLSSNYGLPVREFLAQTMHPPSASAIDDAMIHLLDIDAIDSSDRITPLGRLVGNIPIHPRLAKMVVLGLIFHCLDPVITYAAHSGYSLLTFPPELKLDTAIQKHWAFAPGSKSDFMVKINAHRKLRQVLNRKGFQAAQRFAQDNCLSLNAFDEAERAIEATKEQLEAIGVLPVSNRYEGGKDGSKLVGGELLNRNSNDEHLIAALLFAGRDTNIGLKRHTPMWRTTLLGGILSHPSSINKENHVKRSVQEWRKIRDFYRLATFSSLIRNRTSKKMMREVTVISPLTVCLFGRRLRLFQPGEYRSDQEESGVEVNESSILSEGMRSESVDHPIMEYDDWLPFRLSTPIKSSTKILVDFRKALHRMLTLAYVELGKGHPLPSDDPVRRLMTEVLLEALRVERERMRVEDEDEHIMASRLDGGDRDKAPSPSDSSITLDSLFDREDIYSNRESSVEAHRGNEDRGSDGRNYVQSATPEIERLDLDETEKDVSHTEAGPSKDVANT